VNITGSRDGKVFFIDDDKIMIDGKMYYEKEYPKNLPKADAYSLLAEVRALEMDEPVSNRNIFVDGYNKAIEDVLEILNKHFSKH
jgi:hypothetical protein